MAVISMPKCRKQEPLYTNAWCRQILQERLLFVASDGEHAIKDHMITLRLDDRNGKTVNNDPEMANQGSKTCSRQDSGMCATGNRPENTGYNVSDC